MKLLFLCVVLRNYHDISTVCARARELIISDRGRCNYLPFLSGACGHHRSRTAWGLPAAHGNGGGQKEPPGTLQAGMLGAASCREVWANGVCFMQPIMGISPLSPNWANQPANRLCKVIPHEIEPIIRWGFLTETPLLCVTQTLQN